MKNQNSFKLLNLENLKRTVIFWISQYPFLHFTNVFLYHYSSNIKQVIDIKTKYVLIFQVLDIDCYTAQYHEFKTDVSYSRNLDSILGARLANIYESPPSPEYDYWKEWKILLVTKNRYTLISDEFNEASNTLPSCCDDRSEKTLIYENKTLKDIEESIKTPKSLDQRQQNISKLAGKDDIENLEILLDAMNDYEIKLDNYLRKQYNLELLDYESFEQMCVVDQQNSKEVYNHFYPYQREIKQIEHPNVSQWNQIHLKAVNKDYIQISIDNETIDNRTFIELGFRDGRSPNQDVPIKAWHILLFVIINHGKIDYNELADREYYNMLRPKINDINKRLKFLFPNIRDKPIQFMQKHQSWNILFTCSVSEELRQGFDEEAHKDMDNLDPYRDPLEILINQEEKRTCSS